MFDSCLYDVHYFFSSKNLFLYCSVPFGNRRERNGTNMFHVSRETFQTNTNIDLYLVLLLTCKSHHFAHSVNVRALTKKLYVIFLNHFVVFSFTSIYIMGLLLFIAQTNGVQSTSTHTFASSLKCLKVTVCFYDHRQWCSNW